MNNSSHPTPPAPPQSAAAHYGQPEITGPILASDKQRLANYLLDRAAIFAAFFVFMIITEETKYPVPESMEALAGFILLMAYPAYLIICESVWQRTLGKLASKTKVVDIHGNKPGFWRIVGRTFARLIPFEAFSFLGGKYPIGWHDSLSGTLVVPSEYTPEQVRSIHSDELKKSKSNSGVAIVLLVIGIIAVIGILASVVLASLTAAREKGRQNAIANSGLTADKGTYENNIFTTPEKDMSAFFPLKPRLGDHNSEDIEGSDVTFTYTSYIATQKRNDYLLAKYEYSEPIDGVSGLDKEQFLNDMLLDLIDSVPEGKAGTSKYVLRDDQPSLDFKFTYEGSGVEGRLAIVNGGVYMAMADYRSGTTERATIDKFLESITFMKK